MAQQLVLNVENPSVMRTLRSLVKCMQGVSIVPQRKKAELVEEPVMVQEDIHNDLRDAFRELKSYREGKVKLMTLEEALDELQD